MSFTTTGSVKVFANPSAREKDNFAPSAFVDARASSETLDAALRDLQLAVAGGALNVSEATQAYMDRVRNTPTSAKNVKDVEILRHAPTTQYTVNTAKKLFVQDRLMPYYRAHRPSSQWAYVNYHSVNFFTGSTVPSDAAWLYPNVRGGSYPNGCYSPSGSFTFELHVNPRYTADGRASNFTAGTILHLSSTYALSLVTGSSLDDAGFPDGFRLLLQLSSSANVAPRLATPGAGATPFAFLSSDNSLRRDKWHHVVVTWGTNRSDAGTGSFYVDGARQGTFVFNSASILPPSLAYNPDVLCLGNFYEGPNSGSSATSLFFNADTALREGLATLDLTTGVSVPASATFRHQLNAEVHDVSLREEYLSPAAVLPDADVTPAPRSVTSRMLYVPPFFVPGSPLLQEVNGSGGLLSSPFHSLDEPSKHPFSAPMSFGVAGRYNSLDNFTRDFATGRHARLLHLSASQFLDSTPGALTANDYLYATASVRLRNLNVLPCDDGRFRPNFELVEPFDLRDDPRFVDDIGAPDHALISLKQMVTGAIYSSLFHQTGTMFTDVVRLLPESGSLTPLAVPAGLYAVHQRTQDASSNEVAFFDVSNLFFGERIRPGSLTLTDPRLSGSNGAVSVTLKDDGQGGLYRADCATAPATWNHVGNVFYEEGVILVKSPALPFFGAEGFDLDFDGEKTVHATKYNVLIDATSYNTSSNTTWDPAMSASFDLNRDADQKFVTISGVNLHDENLNVVMRAQLAQPIVKRKGDRFLIRLRHDW